MTSSRSGAVPASVVLEMLRRGDEVALIDVRTEREHATGHPLFAASFPRQRLEVAALDLLPRRDVPLVVFGASATQSEEAVATLRRLGFTAAAPLVGGLDGWVAAGGELFTDVNAPSKAFGELVEAQAGTPSIAARDLAVRLAAGDDIALVDARTFAEHRTMTVPGSRSVGGAELVARVDSFASSPTTTVVVHCAGRTRSIVGAQSLIDAGVPNPVVALRNGTIGWTLAGLELELGNALQVDLVTPPSALARERAAAVAARAGVRTVSVAEVGALVAGGRRSVYRVDVRTHDEHVLGHPDGFVWVPGGQLVQETDAVVPVRGAVVILYDDAGPRAHMTASWLAQMAWDVRVLEGPAPAAPTHRRSMEGVPDVERITPARLAATAGAVVVDVSSSVSYRRGHVPGATWATRRDVVDDDGLDDVVLVCDDDAVAAFVAADVVARGRRAAVLDGGTPAWVATGLPLDDCGGRWASEPDDVYVRPYVGVDVAAHVMQAYLDWEGGLVAQLERDGTHGFWVLGAR